MRAAPRLAWVSDRHALRSSLPERAAALARGGVDLIQLREHDLPDSEFVELGRAVGAAIAFSPARLSINDRIDLALAVGAGGLHLKSDGVRASEARALLAEQLGARAGDFLIGRSCHGGQEIAAVALEGAADYVTLSPLHASGSKRALGIEGFARELIVAREAAGGRPLPTWLALGAVSANDVESLAPLAEEGERWGLAAVRLFQDPESDEEAGVLAASLVAALSFSS